MDFLLSIIKNRKYMCKSFDKIVKGYKIFREKYSTADASVMHELSVMGQNPEIMVVACCDSRVDPALIMQCDPGELFVVRNVANIVPHYSKDDSHHGTSAALEFGIRHLQVRHLILLGHSQCGGIAALLSNNYKHLEQNQKNDFIDNWVSLIDINRGSENITEILVKNNQDEYAKSALIYSYKNCMTFPWIKSKVDDNILKIHLWFFDIKNALIYSYDYDKCIFRDILSEYQKINE